MQNEREIKAPKASSRMNRFGHKPGQGPTEPENQALPRQRTDLWRIGFAEPSVPSQSRRFAEFNDGQMPLSLDESDEKFERYAVFARGLDGVLCQYSAGLESGA